MKKVFSIIALAVYLLTGLTGCIKNDPVVFKEQQVEFDATTWNANSAGLTYPILGRIPGYGRVANTTDSTLRRYPQTIKIRINLIGGGQLSKAETVGYETFTSPITSFSMPATISGQTPIATGGTLIVSDAVLGTHYAPLSSSTFTFPANSSFAFLEIQILNPGSTPATGRFIGLRLNNNGTLKRAINYSELGLVIDQR